MQLDEITTISVEMDLFGTEYTVLDRLGIFEDIKVYADDATGAVMISQTLLDESQTEVLELSKGQAKDLLVALSKAITD